MWCQVHSSHVHSSHKTLNYKAQINIQVKKKKKKKRQSLYKRIQPLVQNHARQDRCEFARDLRITLYKSDLFHPFTCLSVDRRSCLLSSCVSKWFLRGHINDLTPSLPRCLLKGAKFETPQPFCLLFCTGILKEFYQNA